MEEKTNFHNNETAAYHEHEQTHRDVETGAHPGHHAKVGWTGYLTAFVASWVFTVDVMFVHLALPGD